VSSETACAASSWPGETCATAYHEIGLIPKRPATTTLTPPLYPITARETQNTTGNAPARSTAVSSVAISCGAHPITAAFNAIKADGVK
jgi:hypothetical protein